MPQVPALIPTEDNDEAAAPAPLPPRFAGLTQMQSAFVRSYVANGDGNATKAARDAGYTPLSAAKRGYILARDPDVLVAMQRETATAMGAIAPMALKTMQLLLKHKSGFVQQTAAADILDRAGFKPVDRSQVQVVGRVTIDIAMD